MKLTVGYDKDLARQFFLRSVDALSVRREFRNLKPAQTAYLAERFSETATVSYGNTLVHPTDRLPSTFLVRLCETKPDRRLLQMAEHRANELLFAEGFMAFGGVFPLTDPKKRKTNLPVIGQLYMYSAFGRFRTGAEAETLLSLSVDARRWIRLLGFMHGLDCLEQLAASLLISAAPEN